MFGNLPVLDLAISIVLIFFLLSVIASGIAETIQMKLKTRSKLLYNSLLKIFNDRNNKNWADMLYRHPLVNSMKKDEVHNPSYISSGVFAGALIDIIIREGFEYKRDPDDPERIIVVPTSGTLMEKFKMGIDTLKPSDVRVMLYSFLENCDRELAEGETKDSLLSKSISRWYDSYMDRVTGWYKRKSQTWLLIVGLAIAVVFNVDTFKLINHFLTNKEAREAAVQMAIETVEKGPPTSFDQSNIPADATTAEADSLYTEYVNDQNKAYEKAKADLFGMGLPIGWKDSTEINIWLQKELKDTLETTKVLLDSIPGHMEKQCVDSLTRAHKKVLKDFRVKGGYDLCDLECEKVKRKYDSLKTALEKEIPCRTAICKELSEAKKTQLQARYDQLQKKYREGLKQEVGFGKRVRRQFDFSWGNFFITLLGWAITGFAVSRGSVFWFENLSRLINLRNAGKKPTSTTD